MYLYRYFKYRHFENLIKEKNLVFVNPLTEWEDQNEGFLFRMMKTREGRETIIEELQRIDRSSSSVRKEQFRILASGTERMNITSELDWFGVRCQSWTYNKFPAKMWENYSDEKKAVRIKVELKRLLQIKYEEKKVEGVSIDYCKELSLNEELMKLLGKSGELYIASMFKTKKAEYDYENEYRPYIILHNLGEKEKNDKDKVENVVKIPLDMDLNELIMEITPHPQAMNEIKNSVKTLCIKNGLDNKYREVYTVEE